jgi:hypothetical protein
MTVTRLSWFSQPLRACSAVGQNSFFPHPFQVFFILLLNTVGIWSRQWRYWISRGINTGKGRQHLSPRMHRNVERLCWNSRRVLLLYGGTADALRHIGLTYTNVMAQNAYRSEMYQPIIIVNIVCYNREWDLLCGIVARVLGYRTGRPGARFSMLPDFLRRIGSGTGSIQPHEYFWGAT